MMSERTARRWTRTLGAVVLTVVLAGCARRQAGEQAAERLAHAQALFEQHCKTAGKKIYRTVDNVDGIYLHKLGSDGINRFAGVFH